MKKQAPVTLREVIQQNFPYALVHHCGMAAFYLKAQPVDGQIIKADDAIFPNGDAPREGEQILCFNCKEIITHADLHPGNVRKLQ